MLSVRARAGFMHRSAVRPHGMGIRAPSRIRTRLPFLRLLYAARLSLYRNFMPARLQCRPLILHRA